METFSFEFLCYDGHAENFDNKTYLSLSLKYAHFESIFTLKYARFDFTVSSKQDFYDTLVIPDLFRLLFNEKPYALRCQKIKAKNYPHGHVVKVDNKTYF